MLTESRSRLRAAAAAGCGKQSSAPPPPPPPYNPSPSNPPARRNRAGYVADGKKQQVAGGGGGEGLIVRNELGVHDDAGRVSTCKGGRQGGEGGWFRDKAGWGEESLFTLVAHLPTSCANNAADIHTHPHRGAIGSHFVLQGRVHEQQGIASQIEVQ